MTPVEIAEYKQRWMSSGHNHPVAIHSDLRSQAKDWCKVQLNQPQWVHKKYTDVYEDTFFFEYRQDANSFCNHFKKWVRNY